MKDSLLTDKQKREIIKLISQKKYAGIISILEKIKTGHAGTAKTKDKMFALRETVKFILESPGNHKKDFYDTGSYFCGRKEDVSKEIGVMLVWRGYKHNKKSVKEILIKTAEHPNWEVREYAAGAFANTLYENREFYKDLIKLTKHTSENVRRAVVFSALALRDKENLDNAFSLLEPLMFDNSRYVKKNLGPFILGSYFGNKFPKETIRQLKIWSRIRDGNVRWNIIMSFNNSFGKKYPEEALKILKLFTGDVDLTVKRAMISTLRFLNKNHKKSVSEFLKKNKLYILKEAD